MKKIERLRGFLLGNLSDRERDAVESSILSDDALFELLLAVEEELVDESARGELSPDEAQRFLRYLAKTPDGARRLELARALRTTLDRSSASPLAPEAGRSGWAAWHGSTLARAAAVAILLGGGLLAAATLGLRARVADLRADVSRAEARSAELQSQLEEARAENERLENARDRSQHRVESLQSPPPRPAIPVLSAGILRSGGKLPTISLARGEPVLRLSLDLAADSHETYRAVLRDVDAREWIAVSGMTALSEASEIRVFVTIPTAGLAAGDYHIALSGIGDSGEPEPIARYDFRFSIQ